MAYDSERGVTVLFGGQPSSGPLVGDTWEWDGGNWEIKAFLTPREVVNRPNVITRSSRLAPHGRFCGPSTFWTGSREPARVRRPGRPPGVSMRRRRQVWRGTTARIVLMARESSLNWLRSCGATWRSMFRQSQLQLLVKVSALETPFRLGHLLAVYWRFGATNGAVKGLIATKRDRFSSIPPASRSRAGSRNCLSENDL
jgi:hypothetical protein